MSYWERDGDQLVRTSKSTTYYLLAEMRWCGANNISFNQCLAEARKQFAKVVREAALKEQP